MVVYWSSAGLSRRSLNQAGRRSAAGRRLVLVRIWSLKFLVVSKGSRRGALVTDARFVTGTPAGTATGAAATGTAAPKGTTAWESVRKTQMKKLHLESCKKGRKA